MPFSLARMSVPARAGVAVLGVAAGATVVVGTTALAGEDPVDVSLAMDGATRDLTVTDATVADVLIRAGVVHEAGDVVEPALDTVVTQGERISYTEAHDLQVIVDGRNNALVSTAGTVEEALAEAQIAMRPTDLPSVPTQTELTDGLVVQIDRVDNAQVAEEEAVPFGDERRQDASMLEGETKVVQEGRPGTLRRDYTERWVNGSMASKTLDATTTVTEPQPEVVAVGTKEKPAPPPPPVRASRSAARTAPTPEAPTAPTAPTPPTATSDGLDWAALAQCESSGNPRAVSATGKYHGLYQFDARTWQGVGGSGVASDASAAEQTARAQTLYSQRGAAPWPECGKRL